MKIDKYILNVDKMTEIEKENYRKIIKRNVIKPLFKIQVLDSNEVVVEDITADIEKGGSISVNYQQGQRRTCSFVINNKNNKYKIGDKNSLFSINRKFRVFVGIEDLYGDYIYWFSQGIFYSSDPTLTRQGNLGKISISGVDKFAIFTETLGYNQMDSMYTIGYGSRVENAVRAILKRPIAEGYNDNPTDCDYAQFSYDPNISADILEYDLKKSPGGHIGDLILEMANYVAADAYYDTNGFFRFDNGTIDPLYLSRDPIWDFSDEDLEYNEPSLSYQTTKLINYVRVVVNLSNGYRYLSVAKNENLESPFNIYEIGQKTYYEDGSSALCNQKRVDDYTKRKLYEKSILQSTISFSCPIIPHLDVNKVITITDSALDLKKERYIIQSISIPLDSGGTMSIQASKMSELPYYELTSVGGN